MLGCANCRVRFFSSVLVVRQDLGPCGLVPVGGEALIGCRLTGEGRSTVLAARIASGFLVVGVACGCASGPAQPRGQEGERIATMVEDYCAKEFADSGVNEF